MDHCIRGLPQVPSHYFTGFYTPSRRAGKDKDGQMYRARNIKDVTVKDKTVFVYSVMQ